MPTNGWHLTSGARNQILSHFSVPCVNIPSGTIGLLDDFLQSNCIWQQFLPVISGLMGSSQVLSL